MFQNAKGHAEHMDLRKHAVPSSSYLQSLCVVHPPSIYFVRHLNSFNRTTEAKLRAASPKDCSDTNVWRWKTSKEHTQSHRLQINAKWLKIHSKYGIQFVCFCCCCYHISTQNKNRKKNRKNPKNSLSSAWADAEIGGKIEPESHTHIHAHICASNHVPFD